MEASFTVQGHRRSDATLNRGACDDLFTVDLQALGVVGVCHGACVGSGTSSRPNIVDPATLTPVSNSSAVSRARRRGSSGASSAASRSATSDTEPGEIDRLVDGDSMSDISSRVGDDVTAVRRHRVS